jgi:hypothetical protein
MDLLTAVNRILPKLGEHPVTSLLSKSPTLTLVLAEIESVRDELTMQGWWFNTHTVTLPLNDDSEIDMAETSMSFIADDFECSIRSGKLFNTEDNTYVWEEAVVGTLITRVPFDELPESVASYVFFHTLIAVYGTDIGVTRELELWVAEERAAQQRATSEHLRNKRYSTTRSRRYSNYRYALIG